MFGGPGDRREGWGVLPPMLTAAVIRAGLNTDSSYSWFWRLDSKAGLQADSRAGEGLIWQTLAALCKSRGGERPLSLSDGPQSFGTRTSFVENSFPLRTGVGDGFG